MWRIITSFVNKLFRRKKKGEYCPVPYYGDDEYRNAFLKSRKQKEVSN